MKTIIDILKLCGGFDSFMTKHKGHIKIEPPGHGYMPLVIEECGAGPRSKYTISVSHFYLENGDVMYDPEMVFETIGEWADPKSWQPISFRMSNPPIERRACWMENGQVFISSAQVKDQRSFMRVWNKNLREQGFVQQWKRQLEAAPPFDMAEFLAINAAMEDRDLALWESLYMGHVLLSADTPDRLRACDVDRVMQSAWNNFDAARFDKFRLWLEPLVNEDARLEVLAWTHNRRA